MNVVYRLDEVCDVVMGQAPRGEAYNTNGDGWPLIAGASDFGENTPNAKKFTTEATKLSRDGDIVLGIRASIGEKVVADGEYCLGRGVAALRAREIVAPRFLWHWLSHVTPRLATKAKGATFKQVNREDISELEIVLPPPAEQRRIAAVLDRVEALRVKRRRALAELDSLGQSIFLDLFGDPVANPKGWRRMPLKELLINIDSGWSPKCLDRPVASDEWGILKLGAVTWCEYDASENKALPSGIDPDPKIEVKVGDILFVRKNTYDLVAACALVRKTPPRLLMSDLIFRLQLNSEAPVDSTFLQQLLVYPTKRKEIQKLASGSAGSMPNISKGRLQAIDIELPPIPLQREFARHMTVIEKLKAAERASLVQMDALFASLQDRAFQGQL